MSLEDVAAKVVMDLKALAWTDGLCHNPDIDECADELEAALRAAPSLHKEGVSPKALKALLDEIEDNECVCGAARAHRTMHNWAYCSLHARLDKVWKLFVDAQDAASPAGRAEQP